MRYAASIAFLLTVMMIAAGSASLLPACGGNGEDSPAAEASALEVPVPEATVLPLRGAAIRFRFVPAADSRFDAQCLVGREVTLTWRRANQGFSTGRPSHRTLVIDERLEVYADELLSGNAYGLEASLPPYRVDRGSILPWGRLRVVRGEVLDVEVPLRDALVIAGRVVDEAGLALRGAKVGLGSQRDSDSYAPPGQYSTTTDEEGWFRIEGADPDLTTLMAYGEPYAPARVTFGPLPPGAELSDLEVVLTRGQSLTGTVRLPDGTPAPRVKVVCVPTDEAGRFSRWRREAWALDYGSFRLEGLQERDYDVWVWARVESGVVRADLTAHLRPTTGRWTARRTAVPAGTQDLDLVLVAPSALAGEVVDEEGAPVTSFAVLVGERPDEVRDPWESFRSSSGTPTRTFTAEDGRFSWNDLPAGTWFVGVEAMGFLSSEPVRVEHPGDEETMHFTLARGGTLSGFVLDPDGWPAPGARLQLHSITPYAEDYIRVDREPSGSDGSFRIPDLSPGRIEVGADLDGFGASERVLVDLGRGATVEDVELQLTRGGALAVEVRNRNGDPVRFTSVQVQGIDDRDWPSPETDKDGYVLVGALSAGEHLLWAWSKNATDGTLFAHATVVEGETTPVLLGGRPRVVVTVTGRVVAGGEPVAGAQVTAWIRGRDFSAVETETDAAGVYSVGLEAGGEVFVRVEGVTRMVVFPTMEAPAERGARELSFTLPTGSVQGTVCRPDGRALPSGIKVVLEKRIDHGSPWARGDLVGVVPERDGSWSCPHLAPGRYDVFVARVFRDGFPALVAGPNRTQFANVTVRGGEVAECVDLVLAPTGVLEVLVYDPAGVPVGDAVVHVRDAAGRLVLVGGAPVRANGRCTITGMPLGTMYVEAQHEKYATNEATVVEVTESSRARVELEVVPATTLTIELASLEDEAEGLLVSLVDAAGREHARATGDHSRWTYATGRKERKFGPLPPGTYRASVLLPDGRRARTEVVLAGESERALVLRPKL